jgi:hypothetical protein
VHCTLAGRSIFFVIDQESAICVPSIVCFWHVYTYRLSLIFEVDDDVHKDFFNDSFISYWPIVACYLYRVL